MSFQFIRSPLLAACLCASFAAFAQTAHSELPTTKQYQQADLTLKAAPIHTRADLLRYLADTSLANPLSLLSPASRERLLDSVTVNSKDEISSYRIEDIRSELAPSDALRVFTLFGMPSLAGHNNNGQKSSELDGKVISADVGIKPPGVLPFAEGYYCNGGYCTKNDSLVCADNVCTPPR